MKQLEKGGVRYLIGNASWSAFWSSLLLDATYTTDLPLSDWNAVLPELEKETFFSVQNIFSISSQTTYVEK